MKSPLLQQLAAKHDVSGFPPASPLARHLLAGSARGVTPAAALVLLGGREVAVDAAVAPDAATGSWFAVLATGYGGGAKGLPRCNRQLAAGATFAPRIRGPGLATT
ncbi:MAG TPA: hypothetical protein VK356_08275, partial [Thermomicrobiales bacterium]|nr:hypothetical protein [Thermomicrobiales bacterium]